MITIHVLAAGELYQHILNAISTFMEQRDFLGLLRISALAGIIMASVGYVKSRDPTIYAKWIAAYVIGTNLILLPKTDVLIDDISSQIPKTVANVPVIFALPVSLITTIGYGLAQSYDALLSMPDDLQYTQTGALFGSRLIQASRDFRIINPQLKQEMDAYFRNCVVGDIRLNKKYSVEDLSRSDNIANLITSKPSPLRMTTVNEKLVSCIEASKKEGSYSLLAKLNKEVKQAYTFFGVTLFGKPAQITYEDLFKKHLSSAFLYYQGLTDESSNIFLQSMMINAMGDGIRNYQAFTDSTAGIVNQQFSKSQLQHRWSWQIAGIKALWFLPLLHTWLTVLLFGVFPLIIAVASLPGGQRVVFYYFQFFFSLQFWPLLFAILNAGMTIYGSHQSVEFGAVTMANLDKVDELHNDLAGVAGYMMMLIPFLANGLVSNLSAAFNGLATSMTGHVQGSTMAAAGEASSGSFGLGQTSFYNTNANNFSANKHDSNWTHMHGMHGEQLGSGVVKTLTGSGGVVFDSSAGISRNVVSVSKSEALTGSMNQAFEQSKAAVINEGHNLQKSIANVAHRAMQLSSLEGHDQRLGEGVSVSESSQYSQALSTINNIASDVSTRLGVSKEQAMTDLIAGGVNAHLGISSTGTLWGQGLQKLTGVSGGVDAHGKYERSGTDSDRAHQGMDSAVSAREAHDFNEALNYVSNVAKSHHFDDSHSKGASLSNQLGTDLREAETAGHHYDAALSRSERIQHAKSYVESQGAQITANMDQVFPSFVADKVGETTRDSLFASPGNPQAVQTLQALGDEFIAQKREELIAQFGGHHNEEKVSSFYQHGASNLQHSEATLGTDFKINSDTLVRGAATHGIGLDKDAPTQFKNTVDDGIKNGAHSISNGKHLIKEGEREQIIDVHNAIDAQKMKAQKGGRLPDSFNVNDLKHK